MKTEVQIREASKIIGLLSASLAELTDKKVPTFEEFVKPWLEQELANPALRDSTKRSKEYQVRRYLLPAFREVPLDKLGNADWNAWVKLTQDKPEIWRITRYFNPRKTLNEIMNAAFDQGVIERKPRLDNPDERRNVGRVLSDREMWWILRHTTYRIFRVFFYTLFKHGYRPREILKWERSMLRWENGKLWVDVPARITKTARARLAPVNPTAAKHICRLMKENPNARFVFESRIRPGQPQLSYHGAWKTACDKIKAKYPEFKHAVPYDSRRTKITRAMIAGEKPVYVAKLLDTSVLQIEKTYAKDDAATLEALVE